MNLNKPSEATADLAAQEKANTHTYQIPHEIPADIFRAYDIRGPVDAEHLTPDLAYAIGLAIGAEADQCDEHTMIVGRDGRLSGSELHQALCAGVLASGINIVDIGLAPTPLVYYATFRFG